MQKTKSHIFIYFALSAVGVLGSSVFLEEFAFILNIKPSVLDFIVKVLFFSILPFLFIKILRAEVAARSQLEHTKAEAADKINRTMVEKERLSAIANRINSLVIITDPVGKILWVNSTFECFTGYALSEIAGKTSSFLHGPKTDPKVQEKIYRDIQTKDFVRAEILNYTKQGEEYWVELNISAIYDDQGNISEYISISNIITEQKRKEDIIARQNALFRHVAWSNSHAIRRPVASILSLARLSEESNTAEELKEIHCLLRQAADELDIELRKTSRQINQLESETRSTSF